MHSSDTDIANTALSSILGQKRIATIDGTSWPSDLVKNALAKAGRMVLGHGLWHRLSVVDTLANIANDRPTEWTYKHRLPSDSARLGGVFDRSGSYVYVWDETLRHLLRPVPTEIVSEHMYSDVEALSIRYVRYRVDYIAWPDPIQWALAWQLAKLVVMPITEDEKRAREVMAQAADELGEAFAWDQSEQLEEMPAMAGMHAARRL